MITCYHFCSNEFLTKLLQQHILYADDIIRSPLGIPETYVKEYVFKIKKINNGKGMFFAWSNPSYKDDIIFDENGQYSLLELNVPENIVIKTNYENWCSLGVDLYEAQGDILLADKLCRERYNMVNGIQNSYDAIFDLRDKQDEIQILLPYIHTSWIVNARKCMNILI